MCFQGWCRHDDRFDSADGRNFCDDYFQFVNGFKYYIYYMHINIK